MINKINLKTVLMDGGGVATKPANRKPGMIEQISRANLVIGSYEDGIVRILKDRYEGRTTSLYEGVSLETVISKTSLIVSQCIFGKNEITIFQEGLKGEIEKAVKETIEKYHTKRGD